MANPLVYRGYKFTGIINLKQDDGTSPDNILPYQIPSGAVVEIHLPQDTTNPTPTPVILSSATPLPSPLVGNEVTIVSMSLGQVSFTCIPTKSAILGVGKNLSVDVKVIKDPSTVPAPVDTELFEKQKTIDVKDADNA